MRLLVWLIFVFVSLNADTLIKPTSTIKASGNVIDMVVSGNTLLVSTDKGSIESYDISTKKQLMKVEFPTIKDFMGDEIYPKVFSTDYLKDSETYLAVVQANSGYRELFTIQNGKKTRLISERDKHFISKAKFVDKNRIIVALLSNEYILYDIRKKEEVYRVHVSYSHFSDFMLSMDKSILVGSSESGEITVLNVNNGKIVKTLKGGNVDNVYKVDIKNGKVLAAGQDRRAIVYDLESEKFSRRDGSFLIYAGALSPKAKLAAFAFSEDNDIVIFDSDLSQRLYTLKGQKSTLNRIIFINENMLASGSDDRYIMIWKLK